MVNFNLDNGIYDLKDFICKSLHLDTFESIYHYLEHNINTKILFAFDGVNEYPYKEKLLSYLSDFVVSIQNPSIKIIISCRIPAWNSLKKFFTVPLDMEYHAAGPNSYVKLGSFEPYELEKVYELYQKTYKIKTNFVDLDQQVRDFFSHPFFLKLTAEAFATEAIPKSLALKAVFEKYLEKCLGENGYESVEYKILERTVELMLVTQNVN